MNEIEELIKEMKRYDTTLSQSVWFDGKDLFKKFISKLRKIQKSYVSKDKIQELLKKFPKLHSSESHQGALSIYYNRYEIENWKKELEKLANG